MSVIIGAIGALITAATTVSKALAVVGLAVQGVKVIGNAITSIAKALGIIKPERDVEEIGDRALQAEEKGMKPENYSSYEEWVKAIEEDDWGYDPEKNKDMDSKKKINKGIDVSTAVTMERFPDLSMEKFFSLSAQHPDFFSEKRMDELGKLAATDVDAFGKVVGYVTGASNEHNTVERAQDVLMDIEMRLDGLSEDTAYDRVAGYKGLK